VFHNLISYELTFLHFSCVHVVFCNWCHEFSHYLTNQFVDFEALLFPKRTKISMPHGKIRLMLVCPSLNVAFVKAPPSTNLQQNTMCIHKLSCMYCISFYHV
jgi:hypothetical protein